METATSSAPETPEITARPQAHVPWVKVGWFTGLVVLCYLPIVIYLVEQWSTDDDMSHGFFVPAIAAWIAWQRRDEILATPAKPNYWALLPLAWGAFQLIVGSLGAEIYLQRTALVVTAISSVWLVAGTQILKKLAFPLSLLFFMIPLPAIIYNRITFPLQIFASEVAENVLSLVGIPVLRDGNVLELAGTKLQVVEACSGIRSLLSLTFLSLVYGFFFDNKTWMRPLLLVATIPIAIVANAARVTITGILSDYDKSLAEGAFHTFEGWVIFMVALGLLMAFHRMVNWLYDQVQKARTMPPPGAEATNP